MGQNDHGAHTARDVLLAAMVIVSQDTCICTRCIAAINTIATAIDIGAVIIAVIVRLAEAPGPPARRHAHNHDHSPFFIPGPFNRKREYAVLSMGGSNSRP